MVQTTHDCPENKKQQENLPSPTCTHCSQRIRQYADIQASVTLHPSARLGKVESTCSGDPVVCCKKNRQKEICEITITQKVCVKIPICYGVTADIENSCIHCCEEEEKK